MSITKKIVALTSVFLLSVSGLTAGAEFTIKGEDVDSHNFDVKKDKYEIIDGTEEEAFFFGKEINGNVYIKGDLSVTSDLTINGKFRVDGNFKVVGDLKGTGRLYVTGTTKIIGDNELSPEITNRTFIGVDPFLKVELTTEDEKMVLDEIVIVADKEYNELMQELKKLQKEGKDLDEIKEKLTENRRDLYENLLIDYIQEEEQERYDAYIAKRLNFTKATLKRFKSKKVSTTTKVENKENEDKEDKKEEMKIPEINGLSKVEVIFIMDIFSEKDNEYIQGIIKKVNLLLENKKFSVSNTKLLKGIVALSEYVLKERGESSNSDLLKEIFSED
ncbi:MAG: hypothetical protein N4A38_00685 [Candidatus Gracilibacteria bacterium]|nr:hypothetical protein [Candidatus Gracilibacteria bacterium]